MKEEDNKCFNCKEITDKVFMIKIYAEFDPIFSGLKVMSKDGNVEEVEREGKSTTKYQNQLCSNCCIIIAKLLSDEVRPPQERGKSYLLVTTGSK